MHLFLLIQYMKKKSRQHRTRRRRTHKHERICVVGGNFFKPFADKDELMQALYQYSNNNRAYVSTYGEIEDWNVEQITNMDRLFRKHVVNVSEFNADISKWNVSNVTSMREMFNDCSSFDAPLNRWDVSKVTDMTGMFSGCLAFKQPLDKWNVSEVTNMAGMFGGCSSFNSPLNGWERAATVDQSASTLSNVSDMNTMFSDCVTLNQPLDHWNMSNVTDTSFMFSGCSKFNQPLNKWASTLKKVSDMGCMFSDCVTFDRPLDDWNVSKVTNMSSMFNGCYSFNSPLNEWERAATVDQSASTLSNVSDMSNMFNGCVAFDQLVDQWNVSKVTNMSNMFNGCVQFNGRFIKKQWKLHPDAAKSSKNVFGGTFVRIDLVPNGVNPLFYETPPQKNQTKPELFELQQKIFNVKRFYLSYGLYYRCSEINQCIAAVKALVEHPFVPEYAYYSKVDTMLKFIDSCLRDSTEKCFSKSIKYTNLNKYISIPTAFPTKTTSSSIKRQNSGTCWAHSVVRNLVRLLQIIRLIPSGTEEYFYYRYFKLITNMRDCNKGNTMINAYYQMWQIIQTHTKETLFVLPKPVCSNDAECSYDEKTELLLQIYRQFSVQFMDTYISTLREYVVSGTIFVVMDSIFMDAIYPTKAITLLLKHCMQPSINVYIEDEDEDEDEDNCGGHMVNIRYWLDINGKIHIGIKNSWGRQDTEAESVGTIAQSLSSNTIGCTTKNRTDVGSFMFDVNKINVSNTEIYAIMIPVHTNEKSPSLLNIPIKYDNNNNFYCDDNANMQNGYKGRMLGGQYYGLCESTVEFTVIDFKFKYRGTWFAGVPYGKGTATMYKYADTFIIDAEWNKIPIRGIIRPTSIHASTVPIYTFNTIFTEGFIQINGDTTPITFDKWIHEYLMRAFIA